MNINDIKTVLTKLSTSNPTSLSANEIDSLTARIITINMDEKKILIMLNATGLTVDEQNRIKSLMEWALNGDKIIYVSFSMDSKPKQPHTSASQMNRKAIPNVKKIIIVASGKGGVGKSTTTLNLAIAFQKQGLRVGVLDADIYGPSLPLMIGTYEKPEVSVDKKLIPIQKFDLSVMSMGFLIDKAMPMIWRGPMVQGALNQLLFEVSWGHEGDLDLLIIDTPPGTGDVHLTLAQQLIIDGAIIVSTPQDMALIDAKKAIAMFEKVSIPVIGMIENMAYFCCPNCGVNTNIFNRGGAHDAATTAQIPFLGAIPLTAAIRIACDDGVPIGLTEDLVSANSLYAEIAKLVFERIY
ncbi:MAG: Mrp/NBP35 family ATP-binding protein [Candidatus Paracaedibacteraceae bacterium]|nr:Mrp/NBP35 family ATP-binding protein [Candidatus Paracaedibacteraceae bacterium]